jgi:hypothetical protein
VAELEPLSPRERAKLYRKYAQDALRAAESAQRAELRQDYEQLAERWIKMAEELEEVDRKP